MSEEDVRGTQLAENLRFYGDMRFKQLTLFIGAMTVLGAALVQHPYDMLTDRLSLRFTVALAGMLFTSVVWVMEVRSSLYWVAIREKLPVKEFWPRPRTNHWRWLNATNAILILHVVSYCFWFLSAVNWSVHRCIVTIAGFLPLAMLILFTVSSYRHMWFYKE